MDFKFCLLAGGRPPCSLLRLPHAHLSESHNFQANTSDDGGTANDTKTPVTRSSEIRIFKLKLFRDYCIFQDALLAISRQ